MTYETYWRRRRYHDDKKSELMCAGIDHQEDPVTYPKPSFTRYIRLLQYELTLQRWLKENPNL